VALHTVAVFVGVLSVFGCESMRVPKRSGAQSYFIAYVSRAQTLQAGCSKKVTHSSGALVPANRLHPVGSNTAALVIKHTDSVHWLTKPLRCRQLIPPQHFSMCICNVTARSTRVAEPILRRIIFSSAMRCTCQMLQEAAAWFAKLAAAEGGGWGEHELLLQMAAYHSAASLTLLQRKWSCGINPKPNCCRRRVCLRHP